MRSRLEQWRALAPWERRVLTQSLLLLPFIDTVMRMAGLRKTRGLLARLAPPLPAQSCGYSADVANRAQRTARLVAIAARRGPHRATCLPQALATWWLLRRRGLSPELRIGVRKGGEPLQAHAWVEYCGVPLGQQPPGYAAFDNACPAAVSP